MRKPGDRPTRVGSHLLGGRSEPKASPKSPTPANRNQPVTAQTILWQAGCIGRRPHARNKAPTSLHRRASGEKQRRAPDGRGNRFAPPRQAPCPSRDWNATEAIAEPEPAFGSARASELRGHETCNARNPRRALSRSGPVRHRLCFGDKARVLVLASRRADARASVQTCFRVSAGLWSARAVAAGAGRGADSCGT